MNHSANPNLRPFHPLHICGKWRVGFLAARDIKVGEELTTYQGVELKMYDRAIAYLKSHKNECIEALETCLRDRIKSENTVTHPCSDSSSYQWLGAKLVNQFWLFSS